MNPAIRVDNLSKRFRLGERSGSYRTLRESLTEAIAAPFRRLRRPPRSVANEASPAEDFWAIRDVSFEVRPGEVVGIIGRNGAGKSTLLKILSRITEPTSGRVALRGRIGSLLEVGTGFHPELSGRENIFLNGAILGMTRQEIRRKFDEIVAFAGMEQFLDTPVKRYSSGMYVRLAFAVAAHFEPEILVVDEVLAVGDMTFQKKCLGKMNEIGQSGRTILFVSHNMAAIEGICHRGVVLERGTVRYAGAVQQAIESYYDLVRGAAGQSRERFTLGGNPTANFQVQEVWITSEGKTDVVGFPTAAPLEIHARCLARSRVTRPVLNFRLNKLGNGPVTILHSQESGSEGPDFVEGEFTVTCSTSDLLLAPGDYSLKVGAKSGEAVLQLIDDAAHFTIRATDFFGTGRPQDPGDGCVVCRQQWQFKVGA